MKLGRIFVLTCLSWVLSDTVKPEHGSFASYTVKPDVSSLAWYAG